MDDSAGMAGLVKDGNQRALARLISLIEREDPSRFEVQELLKQDEGCSHRIGITGPPGAGKSTLTDKICAELRKRGSKVGIVAIDPSSPFTGGAILGDRIRMMRHSTDPGVFIRSLASRGYLGGLSRATAETVRAMEAAGCDFVIIETVGVGQSEVDIISLADTVVLVSVPGLGDDIQAIKAGIMEIGDVFCVNKADRAGADRVVSEIRTMLETAVLNGAHTRFGRLYSALAKNSPPKEELSEKGKSYFESGAMHHIKSFADVHPELRIPPVVQTIAESAEGVPLLMEHIISHKNDLEISGELSRRRRENISRELVKTVTEDFLSSFSDEEKRQALEELSARVMDNSIAFQKAAIEAKKLLIGEKN